MNNTYQKYKTDLKVISRRGLNNLSSLVLDELFQLYPNSISSKSLSKNLDLREKSVITAIRNIKKKESLDNEKKGKIYKKFKNIFSDAELMEIKEE